MESRKVVYKTLEFDRPDRIARQMWILPWTRHHYPKELAAIQKRFPDDIVRPVPKFREQPKTKGGEFDVGYYIDEWGCKFENKQYGIIGEVKEPLVATWSDIDRVRVPKECLSVDVDAVNEFCRQSDNFVMAGCCPRPFERLQFLRGTENAMMDIALGEPDVEKLLGIIHEFDIQELSLWAKTNVDALVFMDDWGSQRSLLISPDVWRKLFKPLYKAYIDIAHSYGKKIFMHSDGYIMDIIGDLIEIGLDALNSQIFCIGVEELEKKFAGKITFWGELDRQHLLRCGTRDEVANAVKVVHENLYREGGAIAQLDFGPGTDPANVMTAFETWEKLS